MRVVYDQNLGELKIQNSLSTIQPDYCSKRACLKIAFGMTPDQHALSIQRGYAALNEQSITQIEFNISQEFERLIYLPHSIRYNHSLCWVFSQL